MSIKYNTHRRAHTQRFSFKDVPRSMFLIRGISQAGALLLSSSVSKSLDIANEGGEHKFTIFKVFVAP